MIFWASGSSCFRKTCFFFLLFSFLSLSFYFGSRVHEWVFLKGLGRRRKNISQRGQKGLRASEDQEV